MAAPILSALAACRLKWCASWQVLVFPIVLIPRSDSMLRLADDLVSIVSYFPPVPHARPALLQTLVTLPPNSTVQLTLDVVKPFLRYTEHPPDAQRGWDLPPAVFIPLVPGAGAANATGRRLGRIYTPVLLVDLATPDFSMPYNVIIMSCTLIALIFGSVFNLLTRKFVLVQVPPPSPEKKRR